MVDLEEFKKALPVGHNLSEEEIRKLNVRGERLVEIIYDIWTDGICLKDKHESQMCKECRINRITGM